MNRHWFAFTFLFLPLVAAPALAADDLPAIGQSAVVTPTRAERHHDLGLEVLWLPVESRASLTDFVGRNLPNAQLDANGSLLLGGGRAGDTALEIDGLRFGRLTLPIGLVERLDVATAGYGAQWSDVLGGVVGVSTRSGSNHLHVDVDAYNEFAHQTVRALAPTVSGPIVRDRLFFALGLRGEVSGDPAALDPSRILEPAPARQGRTLGGGFKLTWVPSAAHQIESLMLLDDARMDNGEPAGVEADAQPTRDRRAFATSLRWVGRFGDVVSVRSQVGYDSDRAEEQPILCRQLPTQCDFIPASQQSIPQSVLSFNWPHHDIDRQTTWQALNALEARVVDRPTVRARLRLTSRITARQLAWASHVPGDHLVELQGGPGALTTYYGNDPRFEDPRYGWVSSSGSSLDTLHALEGETRLFERLWVLPGLGLSTGHAHTSAADITEAALSPHLTLAWDVRGDGRTWLRASSHRRAVTDLAGVVALARETQFEQRCRWDSDTMSYSKDCVLSGGLSTSTVGLPCGPTNVRDDGSPCDGTLRPAHAWEHTIGAEQALPGDLRLSADLVYRRAASLIESRETNRIWNSSGSNVTGYRDGRAQTINDVSSNPNRSRRYLAMTAALTKQSGAWKLLCAYTFSRDREDVWVRDRYLEGPGSNERPHSFRLFTSYDLFGYAALGAIFSHDSGLPFRQLYYTPFTGKFENYNAAVGTNPGANVNDPSDDRTTRTPDVSRLNFQLRVRARRLVRADIDIYGDLINALDLPAAGPRYARLGLQGRY
jgi:hypothetical protein